MADDTITLVSTTDSLEDVQAALTGKPVEKPAETPVAQTPAPSEPSKTPAPPPAAPVEEPPAETPPVEEPPVEDAAAKPKKTRQEKIQKEIDELTWRKNATRRDVEAEEVRLATLRQQAAETQAKLPTPPAATPPATPATDAKPEPKLDALDEKGTAVFATYEDYLSAHAKWTAEEAARVAKQTIEDARTADRARIEQESASRVVNERLTQYNANLETFKKTHADFDAAFDDAKDAVQESLAALGPQALKVIDGYTVFDAEDGPALTYYLLKHPDELKAVAVKAPQQQLIHLARLEERLHASTAPKKTGPVLVAAPETKAPTPITPVSAGPTATTTVSLDEAEFQDYKRARERQIRERRGA
jgi:hypothetical protein